MEAAAWVSAIATVLLVFGGWYGGFFRKRSEQLRRDDVLLWAKESIEALQTIVVLCRLAGSSDPASEADARMTELVFRTSILVEQGRLFFRNVKMGNYGAHKPLAYQGLRPKILDHLVLGHDITCAWPDASTEDRLRLGFIAEERLKEFVSTVQREVGRDRTAYDGAAAGGLGAHLPSMIDGIDDQSLRDRGWLD